MAAWQQGWSTVIAPTGGGGGVAIAFCPQCGAKLNGRRRGVSAE